MNTVLTKSWTCAVFLEFAIYGYIYVSLTAVDYSNLFPGVLSCLWGLGNARSVDTCRSARLLCRPSTVTISSASATVPQEVGCVLESTPSP